MNSNSQDKIESTTMPNAAIPTNAGSATYGVPYYSEPPQAEGIFGSMDLLRLLNILLKRWLTIALVVLFMACAGIYYLGKATRLYRATATIELSTRRPRILNQQAAVIEDPAAMLQIEETLNTQMEKFKSASILPSVLACYRQKNPDDTTPDEILTHRLQDGVAFSLLRRTRLVMISFLDDNPVFAAHACQAFAEGTEAAARAENRTASDAAVAWLEAQAKIQKQELEKADQTLFDARQKCKMDVLEGQRKTVDQALLSFNQTLVGVEGDLAMQRELLDALNAIDIKPENVGKLPASIARAKEVESAMDRWIAAVAEHDSLLSKYTPEHPEVVARGKAVELYHGQLMAALARTKTTAASNLELLKRQAESLRHNKDEQSKLASNLERDILDVDMKLASLQRTRAAADVSYQGILNRIQEARLSADENTATVKLVEGASLPGVPVSPNVIRILLMALCLGFAGGMGLALVIDTMEDRVVDARDVETNTGLKILAVVPHVRRKKHEDVAAAVLTQHFGELTEAFAGLRSVLDSPSYREQSKIVLVCSSLPKEGKTTASANFAATSARNGQRVLLIDFDLRRPRMAGIFPMPAGQRGLLDYLAKEGGTAMDLVYATACPNLSVIASRPTHGVNPAEFVGGQKVVELLTWARANFDRVIIDAPPLGIVSDAIVLAGLVDCVLIMARPSVSRKRVIRHTVSRFRDVGVGAIAVVMNDMDFSKSACHGYGPYYHYRKHYGTYHDDTRATGSGLSIDLAVNTQKETA